MSEICLRGIQGSSRTILKIETLNTVEKSRRDRHECIAEEYREVKCEAAREVKKQRHTSLEVS